MANIVLLLVDVQVNMFTTPTAVAGATALLDVIRRLADQANAHRVPVVCVRHNGGPGDPDFPGTPGWELMPEASRERAAIVVDKTEADAFSGTGLQAALARLGATHLVVAGVQTDMCIDATCRRAHELGYRVTLVQDGHGTFDGRQGTAQQAVQRVNAELASLVRVVPAGRIDFAAGRA
jgi:streptothricin hydrolase